MNLIWHTALSVFDLGSSLLYSLLGRDLTESEIAIIELFFRYMRKTKYVTRQSAVKKKRNLMDVNHIENDLKQLIFELKFSRLNLSCLVEEFLSKYDLESKDLLLISSRRNGYNLLQFSIESLMVGSFRWLENAYKFYLNDESRSVETEYDKTIEQHMHFINILLEKYGCDPNRGILLSNKSKYTIGFSASEDEDDEDEASIIDDAIDTTDYQTNIDHIRSRIWAQKQKIHKHMHKAASSSSISGSMFSQTSNLNLKSVTNFTDETSLKELNQTPIDSPLLMICCIYNCHNLLNQTASFGSTQATGGNIASNESGAGSTVDLSSSRSGKLRKNSENGRRHDISNGMAKSKESERSQPTNSPFTSIASTIREPNKNFYKRRHTIHCDNTVDFTNCVKSGLATLTGIASQGPNINNSGAATKNSEANYTKIENQIDHSQTPVSHMNRERRRRITRSYARKPPQSYNSSASSSSSSAWSSNRNPESYGSVWPPKSRSPNESDPNASISSSCSSPSSNSKNSSSSSFTMSSSTGKSNSSSRASTEVYTQLPTHCPSCNSSLISDFISDHSIFGSAFNDSINSFNNFKKKIMSLTNSAKREENEGDDESDIMHVGGCRDVTNLCDHDYNFENCVEKLTTAVTSDHVADIDVETDYDDEDEESEREGFEGGKDELAEGCYTNDRDDELDSDSNNEDEDEDLDSNIFDYDLENADEENYFNRYDFDCNNYCFRNYLSNYNELQNQQKLRPILSSNTIVNSGNIIGNYHANMCANVMSKPVPSLSTSIHSLPSSSNHAPSNRIVNSQKSYNSCSTQMQPLYSSKNKFIYEKLNRQRLEIVDMLLKNGADKYLVGKLSYHNVEKLNRKSLMLLKKWYGMPYQSDENFELKSAKTTTACKEQNGIGTAGGVTEKSISKSSSVYSLSKMKYNEQRGQSGDGYECDGADSYGDCASQGGIGSDPRSVEIRPLSPIMASLCLDDVDMFARLYKHHQPLFNYFKPDEDYELIYYAIKFQSKSCLIYLLSNTNSHTYFPSVLEHSKVLNSRHTFSGQNKVPRTVYLKSAFTDESSNKNHLELQLSKNVNTMFYILENTRSAKIVKVLLRCGFDLTKREPLTGNTALHCIFNASKSKKYYDNNQQFNATQKMLIGTKKCILNEFQNPKSLSRILFVMLKMGGLKTHVNTLNNEKKLCSQVLFEWDELIARVFFWNDSDCLKSKNEWKREFKQCIKLLLKSGADMLLNTSYNNGNETYTEHHNCVDVLFTSLLKHALKNENSNQNDNSEFKKASPPVRNAHQATSGKSNTQYSSRHIQKNTFDVDFLYTLLNDCIDLNTLTLNLMRQNHYYHQHLHHSVSSPHYISGSESPSHRVLPKECIVEKFLEILLHVRIESFGNAYKILKLICHFQKFFNLKYRSKNNSVSSHLVRTLVNTWINNPNFLNSTHQFEKNRFIKLIIIELILNDLLDLNDNSTSFDKTIESSQTTSTSSIKSTTLVAGQIESNNLINHCVKLLFTNCKTGYQIELISDLMRTLVQYGARPCLSMFGESFSPQSFISSVGDLVRSLRPSKRENKVNYERCRTEDSQCAESGQICNTHNSNVHHQHHHQHHHHHHHHHNHRHHRKNYKHKQKRHHTHKNDTIKKKSKNAKDKIYSIHRNYFLDYFNGKSEPIKISKSEHSFSKSTPVNQDGRVTKINSQRQNQLLANSDPILLLTPSPSFLSLLHINSTSPNSSLDIFKSKNIVIESSILYLRQFKKITGLLLSSIESNYSHCFIIHSHLLLNNNGSSNGVAIGQNSAVSNCYPTEALTHQQRNENKKEFSSLDTLIEKISSHPKSLKTQARQCILNHLIGIQRKQRSDHRNHPVYLIKNQALQLPLPKRIQNYLLFIN